MSSLRARILRKLREGRNSLAMTRTETQARHWSQAAGWAMDWLGRESPWGGAADRGRARAPSGRIAGCHVSAGSRDAAKPPKHQIAASHHGGLRSIGLA